jgi:photosystem II stability/assembly factor-like uncharacterized protein
MNYFSSFKALPIILLITLFTHVNVFAQWASQYVNTSDNLMCVHYQSASSIFIGRTGFMTLSTNGGATWMHNQLLNPSNNPYLGSAVYDTYFFSPTNGIAGGMVAAANSYGTFQTTNSAQNWSLTFWANSGNYPRTINEFAHLVNSIAVGVGTNGLIIRTTDAGLTWSQITSPVTTELYSVYFPSATHGYIGTIGGILKTTTGGLSWTNTPLPGITIKNIWFYDNNIGYAAGFTSSAGVFMKTTDGGNTWVNMPNPITYDVYTLCGTGLDTLYLGSGLSRLYYSTNGGAWWNYFPSSVGRTVYDIDFLNNSDTAIASCDNGYILKTNNGGGIILAPVALFSPGAGTTVCQLSSLPFNNFGNPAWSYEWLLDNVPVSTNYSPNITFPQSGLHQIKLVAINGAYRDTSSFVSINVTTVPQLGSINASTLFPVICPNNVSSVRVLNSQSGVSYRLMSNNVQIGTPQIGNGGTLNFITQLLASTTIFEIEASATNTCGTNTISSVPVTITVASVNDQLAVSSVDDSICSNQSTFVLLNNSVVGVIYSLRNGATQIGTSQTGTGGTLSFPTGSIASTTTFNIRGINSQGCWAQMVSTALVYVDSPIAQIGVVPSNVNINTPISLINNSTATSYFWNFGSSAIPQTSTLVNPVVTFTSSGTQQIILGASLGQCTSYDTLITQASNPIPSGSGIVCSNSNLGTRFYGHTFGYRVLDYCTDRFGNTYATGYYDSSGVSTNYNLFVYKFNAAGTLVWQHKQIHTNYNAFTYGSSFGTSIAVDSSGNIYVGGCFASENFAVGSLNFASLNYYTSNRGFVVKFNSSGNPVWRIEGYSTVGNGAVTGVTDIICRSNNEIYFSCVGSGPILYVFGAGPAQMIPNLSIVRINANGAYQGHTSTTYISNFNYMGAVGPVYTAHNPSNSSFTTWKVAYVSPKMEMRGNLIYVGTFGVGTIAFGQDTVVMSNANNAVIARYDMNSRSWLDAQVLFHSTTANDFTVNNAPVFTVDYTGCVYWSWQTLASFTPITTFGSTNYSGNYRSFIARFSPSGVPLWVNTSNSPIVTKGLVWGNDGIIGFAQSLPYYMQSQNFTVLQSTGNTLFGFQNASDSVDVFLYQYDSTGVLDMVQKVVGVGDDYAQGMAAIDCENVAVLGVSGNQSAIGNTTLTSSPNKLFTFKYNLPGVCQPGTCSRPLFVNVAPSYQAKCRGTCDTLVANANFGTPPYSYSWAPGNATTRSIIVCPNTTTTYTCTITDAAGNVRQATSQFIINPGPPISISGDTASCFGTSVVMLASGGSNYLWNPSGWTGNQYIAYPTATVTYTVSSTDQWGCTATATHTILYDTTTTISFTTSPTSYCNGDTIQVIALNMSIYNWLHNGSTSSTVTIVAYDGGVYLVDGYSTACYAFGEFEVTTHPIPTLTLNFSAFDTLCSSAGIIPLSGAASPSGGTFYGPGVTNNIFDPAAAGYGLHTITYNYTDSFSCAYTNWADIFVDICTGNNNSFGGSSPTMYFNASTQQLSINFGSTDQDYTIDIFDLSGRSIRKYSGSGNNFFCSLDDFPAGVFLVRFMHNGIIYTRPVIIKN